MGTVELVRVCKTTHARHDAEYIVVGGIYVEVTGGGGAGFILNRFASEVEKKGGVIDTGHVASTRGLVFFGFEAERVDIHTSRRDVGVVLVGLDKVKVATFALAEAVVAVELQARTAGAVFTLVEERETTTERTRYTGNRCCTL